MSNLGELDRKSRFNRSKRLNGFARDCALSRQPPHEQLLQERQIAQSGSKRSRTQILKTKQKRKKQICVFVFDTFRQSAMTDAVIVPPLSSFSSLRSTARKQLCHHFSSYLILLLVSFLHLQCSSHVALLVGSLFGAQFERQLLKHLSARCSRRKKSRLQNL